MSMGFVDREGDPFAGILVYWCGGEKGGEGICQKLGPF